MERVTNANYVYAIPNAMKALSLINASGDSVGVSYSMSTILTKTSYLSMCLKSLFDMFDMSCHTYQKYEIVSDIKGKNKTNSDVSFMYLSMITQRTSSSTYKR